MKPRSHRLHRLIGYGLIGLLVGVVLFCTAETQRTQSRNILVIDLSKKSIPYQDEYEKMLYPTVRIKTTDSTGSGVIFETTDEHRYTLILTAAHVVGDESEVTVELFLNTQSSLLATVVMTDTAKDLALLQLRNANSELRIYKAALAPKDYTPYLFHPVYVVGCSLGLKPRPSHGIISVVEDTYWGISAPILPGNSGGPVYDSKTFEVIGIAVWVHTHQGQLVTTMAGIVPIDQIQEFITTKTLSH